MKARINALDAMPRFFRVDVDVMTYNNWRVRLGLVVLGLAARILGARLEIQIDDGEAS